MEDEESSQAKVILFKLFQTNTKFSNVVSKSDPVMSNVICQVRSLVTLYNNESVYIWIAIIIYGTGGAHPGKVRDQRNLLGPTSPTMT